MRVKVLLLTNRLVVMASLPPEKLAAPPICPVVAVAPILVPLLALLVESFTLSVVPLERCHTPT